MTLEEISEFTKDGLFSAKDKIEKNNADLTAAKLFGEYYTVTKDIGKENPFIFIPMIKNLGR